MKERTACLISYFSPPILFVLIGVGWWLYEKVGINKIYDFGVIMILSVSMFVMWLALFSLIYTIINLMGLKDDELNRSDE